MKTIGLLGLLGLLCCGCGEQASEDKRGDWEAEIVETERAFSKMAGEVGIPEAFLEYAAEEAVLMRGNSLIKGMEAISQHLNNSILSDSTTQLSWEPDFVSVSASGDLGYTYGQYVFSMKDSLGQTRTQEGIFHTVWKRQSDGSWRFVWD
ncbi:YybH family protein [Robiginitalea sp. IMCC44478]|uniref:YybH family protein n=1 Tax=Robiginitalea sp. IMCC44478 TaxID=3459122 RepID=UPI0040420C34